MKNYSAMSDFEISRLIGDKLGIEWANLSECYHPLSSWGDGNLEVFDPCNSWADAGPIIQEENIGINPEWERCCEDCGDTFHTGTWEACVHDDGYNKNYEYAHENPLLAAMIVFLMMKDAE